MVYSSGASLCSVAGNTATVTFVSGMGNAPLLEVIAADTLLSDGVSIYDGATTSVVMAVARDGTTERVECSNRGTCNRASGACLCQEGYSASNGDNLQGAADDCGHHDGITVLACPGTPVCSGNGVCDTATGAYECKCYRGFQGADCSRKACPVGVAWFDEPYEMNKAHRSAECSNKGICGETSG